MSNSDTPAAKALEDLSQLHDGRNEPYFQTAHHFFARFVMENRETIRRALEREARIERHEIWEAPWEPSEGMKQAAEDSNYDETGWSCDHAVRGYTAMRDQHTKGRKG